MATRAVKRQKVHHDVPDEEENSTSFAAFGAESEDQNDTESVEDDQAESEDEPMMDDDNENSNDDEPGSESINGQNGRNQAASIPRHRKTAARKDGLMATAASGPFVAGNHKSTMFKLQLDDLLEQLRPRRGKTELQAAEALHQLKSVIENIPSKGPLAVDEAESQLLSSSKVQIPFPDPRPTKDAKYKFQYARPSNINVIGSHILKTSSRSKKVLEIDMVVTMPSSVFQEKDYLNFRYFYKRAYYIASIAAGIKATVGAQYDTKFHKFRNDSLKPILVVMPIHKSGSESGSVSSHRWQINVIPCIGEETFQIEKLDLNRACVRHQCTLSKAAAESLETPKATPFYNSSLRSDMLATPYLKLLHGASKSCEAFRDACLLGSTWLRQRGFESDIHAGGFGNFEFSALMACLLQGGGPGGRAMLNETYSSYQLFKATVQLLAMRDLSKQPLTISSEGETAKLDPSKVPIVWDSRRKHNLFYKMTLWSYKLLRREARTTLNTLGDQQFDGFDATFVLRADGLSYRYDYVLQTDASNLRTERQEATCNALGSYHQLYDVMQKGLGDRAKCITILTTRPRAWALESPQPDEDASQKISIGIMTNADKASLTIDHGPAAEAKSEAAIFRKFWGDKAELRRFKDGNIQETLVWSGKESGPSVVEQICLHLIQKHFGKVAEQDMTVYGDGFRKLLPQGSTNSIFPTAMDGFKQLENDIRSLDGLPLVIRQITPADAQLRYVSIRAPTAEQRQSPADVVLQFEGSSSWPDDLMAIQRTKIAFLLRLREQLLESIDSVTARLGLENEENSILSPGFLDIVYDTGMAFRLRIHHDREQTLLERQVKDKATDPGDKEKAVLGLAAYKRDYIKAPTHTQAIARLCSRYPALSGTIRLLKKWFASHLLANHTADEVIELMAARTFVQPWPWESPASVQTGFLRTLSWLSRWDWKAEPLIVDLSGAADLTSADVQSIRTKFEAWRKLDPALNRVVLFAASNLNQDGTTWTDGCPVKVVAGRMTALARAACAETAEKERHLTPSSLFESALGDYDFVILV